MRGARVFQAEFCSALAFPSYSHCGYLVWGSEAGKKSAGGGTRIWLGHLLANICFSAEIQIHSEIGKGLLQGKGKYLMEMVVIPNSAPW